MKTAASISDTLRFGPGWNTRLLLAGGTLGGMAHGLALPMVAYFLSRSFETFSDIGSADSSSGMAEIREISYTFMLLGVYSLVTAFCQTCCFELMAYHKTRAFQLEWFRALLRQDAAFFDIHGTSNISPATILNFQQGLGRKLGELVQNITTGIAGVALGLYSSWRVSLLVFAILPLTSAASLKAIRMNQGKTARAQQSYQQAGSVAYGTLSALTTILSLNAVPARIQHYQTATLQAFESATTPLLKLGIVNGGTMASVILLFVGVVLFGSYTMYRDVRDSGCNPGGGADGCENTGADIFAAMMGIMFAGQSLSQIGNCLAAFTGARVAAAEALKVINRTPDSPEETFYDDHKPSSSEEEGTEELTKLEEGSDNNNVLAILPRYQINPFAHDGIKPSSIEGTIEFRNVTFRYPSRPGAPILHSLNLQIPAGKTVALVGSSGGGKSTVLALMERFYDPLQGQVTLDGVDLKELNVAHYRHFLGYVGQEPSLFATSIRENIGPSATLEDIQVAARAANCHDFISALPEGYDTPVGEQGSQLSGGQKQRIAIARVLLKQPQILLLDEATSALDSESELVVQEALDNVLQQRQMTAVIVAHRLSTIRNADLIYVINGGSVVESGTHDQLMMEQSGHYRQLVEKQQGKPSLSREASSGSLGSLGTPLAPADIVKQAPLIEFRNVHFSYPSRPNKAILQNFNLKIFPGETLALVGPSGGGKSTTVAMIERFYDPSEGAVEYRQHDIKALHPGWYRDQIGYVGQEPTLFAGTIADNIKFGAPLATQLEIAEAAIAANCHDFIMNLPLKYNTQVGESGTQLSGGQKQRVAIARALIKKPSLLLLDESTSALDSESEAIVQEALAKLMRSPNHTVIVIAHKLSTIQSADRIAVVGKGKVLEVGSHEELIEKERGHYKRLVEAQKRDTSLHTLGLSAPTGVVEDESQKDDNDNDDEGDKDLAVKEERISSSAKRVKQMASPDLVYIMIGAIGAVLSGASYPLLGVLFASTINVFFFQVDPCTPDDSTSCTEYWDDAADDMQSESFKIAGFYSLLFVNMLVGSAILFWGFGQASERLSKRIRDSVFTALVRQEVGFFDCQNVGEIMTQLQESTARLHAFTGAPIRSFLEAMTSLVVGLLLSFIVMWPYALMCIGCMIPMAFAANLRNKSIRGEDEGKKDGNAETASAGAIMVETLLSIKTVAALGLEGQQMQAFEAAVEESQKEALRESAVAGVMTGVGFFIQRWSNALLYFWGGYLLLNYPDLYDFDDFLISQFAFIFSTFGLAAALQDLDDRKEVEASARWIFKILDRRSLIDPLSDEGKKLDTCSYSSPKSEGSDHFDKEPRYTEVEC